jgi:CelD/BcsL family acetyltransferase involved in cellulose biosynthesis
MADDNPFNRAEIAEPPVAFAMTHPPLKFELIQSTGRFREIVTPWQMLWRKSEASAFQSYHWISEWQRNATSDYRLHIGVFWDCDGHLVAVVPCVVRRRWGVRILEWAAQEESDYCDGFGDPESLRACWTALLELRHYDIIRLKNVRSDARIATLLPDHRIAHTDVETCLLLRSAWPDGDTWVQAHYPKSRNSYSRGWRKLEEMGRVDVEVHTAPPDGVVEQLSEFKREWAIKNGIPAPILENRNLLSGLVNALSSVERLLMISIKCNDKLVAASIMITHNQRMLSYLSAYDPAYGRASPGIILLTECTRWAFNNGFT